MTLMQNNLCQLPITKIHLSPLKKGKKNCLKKVSPVFSEQRGIENREKNPKFNSNQDSLTAYFETVILSPNSTESCKCLFRFFSSIVNIPQQSCSLLHIVSWLVKMIILLKMFARINIKQLTVSYLMISILLSNFSSFKYLS